MKLMAQPRKDKEMDLVGTCKLRKEKVMAYLFNF